MTAAAMLIKEIETLPEEAAAEALDFVLFLRTRKKPRFGAGNAEERFPGMDKPAHLGFDFGKISREELYER